MIHFADDYQERPGLRQGAGQLAERLRTGFAWLDGQEPADECMPVTFANHNRNMNRERPSNTPHTHKAA